jgi:hypothetical protein
MAWWNGSLKQMNIYQKLSCCIRDTRLPIFLLAHRASTHDTIAWPLLTQCLGENSVCPATCYSGHPGRLATWHPQLCPTTAEVGQWTNINLRQLCQLHGLPGEQPSVALSPNCKKGMKLKLQLSQEGPYRLGTQINDVVYRIQCHPRRKMTMVHLDRLVPHRGANHDPMERLVGEQQHETQTMRKQDWMLWKPRKCWPQYDDVPFAKVTADATDTSPQKRRNGDTPVA